MNKLTEMGDENLKEKEIKIFEFEKQGIEVIYLNGEPIFNPLHVAKTLDIGEPSLKVYLAKMNDIERLDLKSINPEEINLKLINDYPRFWLRESGLYKLIFKSRKPEAEKFVMWVTHEVLPSIRKSGSYDIQQGNQWLNQITNAAEKFLGIKKREIAITQNESWNMKLAKLIWDCSRQEMGSTKDLYNELVYLFAEKTGFNVNELAEATGMTRQKYLIKNQEVCKTLYEFAVEHFYSDTRQVVLIPFNEPEDQSRLTEWKKEGAR